MTRGIEERHKPKKKDIAKAYGKYAKLFTPKPSYLVNCMRAFLVGGALCCAALWFQNYLEGTGLSQKTPVRS